jgi:uncharacterized protein (TIGR02466 family)
MQQHDPFGRKLSNSGGWQSQLCWHVAIDNLETTKLFNSVILPAVNSTARRWGVQSDMNEFNYWYNINFKYNYNTMHYHSRRYLSGVYYLQVPKDSGNIIFNRSQTEKDRMSLLLEVANGPHAGSSIVNHEYQFEPRVGALVLFPSWLSHDVRQNLTTDTDDRRISMSFDFY